MVEYKAKLVGIEFKSVSEHHTSKCSALDFELIQHHQKYMGKRKPPIKGRKRKKELSNGGSKFKRVYPRGLFRSAKGYTIHSDVNGSFNIGRVAYPNLFNQRSLTVENMLLNPISVEIEV
jgi:transposase